MEIVNLSKAELLQYSELLVKNLLAKHGYDLINISDGKVRTKFRIIKNKENNIIKISFYRYNRNASGNYAFFLKHLFNLDEYDYLFFVLYIDNIPHILKIPTQVFRNPSRDSAFKNRDYEGKKSLPEYGIVMNKNTLSELLMYEEK